MGEVTEIKLILHMEELDSSDQKKKVYCYVLVWLKYRCLLGRKKKIAVLKELPWLWLLWIKPGIRVWKTKINISENI